MAYTEITAGQVDADSPLDATLMGTVKDNFIDHEDRIAVGEAGGFPFGSPTAGEYIEYHSPVDSAKTGGGIYTTLTPVATIKVGAAGTYRIKFYAKHDAGGGGVGYAKLYKNGGAIGTERALTTGYVWYSEDIALAAGDTIEVWGYVTSGGTTIDLTGFRVCVAAPVLAGAYHG